MGLSSPAVALIDREMWATLDDSRYQIELYPEYLETTLFDDPRDQQEFCESYIRGRGRCLPARIVEHVRIVLRAADGLLDKEIAQQLGITREKAARWGTAFSMVEIAALERDAPRPGRTRIIRDRQ